MAVSAVLLFDAWEGDSAIGMIFANNIADGRGLVFNKAFSSAVTSPLWPFILSVGFLTSEPLVVAKLISIGLLVAFIFINRMWTGATIYFITKPALMGFETALFFVVCALLYIGIERDNKPVIYSCWTLLPLCRPEGIVLLLLSLFITKDMKSLSFLLLYFGYLGYCIVKTGLLPYSIIERAEIGYISHRYFFFLIPIIAYILTNIWHNLPARHGAGEV